MRAATVRAVLTVSVVVTALAACSSSPSSQTQPSPSEEGTPTVTSSTSQSDPPAEGTAILLTIGDTTLDGQLWDNPAARDLAARLPLTLTVSDYNGVEKTARLDPPLTMDGMPAGDDPNPGEIGWYAPSSDLVLYYGDVGYWNGIARLGTFSSTGVDLLADGPREVTVTLERASG